MCTPTLIDASVFGTFLKAGRNRPLWRWIRNGHGIMMYAGAGRYADELQRSQRMWIAMEEYRKAGTARLVPKADIEHAEEDLTNAPLESDDRHMLALALAGSVSVLHSTDYNLRQDFKRLPKVGRTRRAVYPVNESRGKQQRFLDQRRCPNRKGTT